MTIATSVFLVFIIVSGIFGIFIGFYDRRTKGLTLVHKPFLRGCVMSASGSIGLVLFLEHVLPGWAVIAGIGILIVIQEYAIIAFGSSALSDHVVANQSLPYSKEQETWTQVRKKGRARFVLVNTALYGVVGILFTFFAVILLPHDMPLYIPVAIILAIAAGGATAAFRQWNWHEKNERAVGRKRDSRNQMDD